jgi:hypothetical protein
MAVVIAYYFGVARVGVSLLESAITGCGLLLGPVLPCPARPVPEHLLQMRGERPMRYAASPNRRCY